MTGQYVTTGDDHSVTDHPQERSAAVAARALRKMSEGFENRNLEALLDGFSEDACATYAGSEVNEVATGAKALHDLLLALLHRDVRYSFSFSAVHAHTVGEAVWVLAGGSGYETTPDCPPQPFPYRVCGLLVYERGDWRWTLLTGAEPTCPPTVSQV